MHGLTVRKKNDPQVATFIRLYFCPASNSAIFLDCLTLGIFNGVKNLFVLDYGTIGPGFDGLKIVSNLHLALFSEDFTIRV